MHEEPSAVAIERSIATPETRPLRPFFTIWSGQAISLLGSQAVQFAIIWWLTIQTGSAAVLATASLLGLLPQVVLGPLSGAIVDRTSRRRVLFGSDAGIAIVSAGLGALFFIGHATPTWVFVAMFVRALGSALHQPAMTAATTMMVPRQHLTRVQGINQSLQGAMLIAAAPLGAMLVAAMPMAGVMAVDVGTALFALAPLLFIRIPDPPRAAMVGPTPNIFRQVADGFAYLRARPVHVRIVSLAAVVNLFLVPAFSLLPLLVSRDLHGSAGQLGALSACFGVGMLLGGATLGAWGGFRPRIVTSLVGLVGLGLGVLAVGLSPPGHMVWPAVGMFAVGWMVPTVNGPIVAVLQATIDPALQGRVFSLFGSLATLAAPLGLMVAAPVAELIGVRAWYVGGAVASMAMGFAGFASRSILRIESSGLESA